MKKLLLITLALLTFILIAEENKKSNATITSTTLNDVNISADSANVEKANIYTIYLAMFNRVPDAKGLEYWEKMMRDENWTITDVSNSFFDQEETKELYPELYQEDINSVQLITNIYQNLFNRYPDGEGLAYWDREISAKLVSPNLFILSIINGAKGADIEFLKSAEEISKNLSSKGLLEKEDFRDVLNILSDSGDKLALEYINYIANEPEVKRVRPIVSIDKNASKNQVKIKVSSKSPLVFGLNIAIFNKPMDRWDMSSKQILSALDIIELVVSSDIYDGDEIKVRLQDKNENIVTGVTTTKIVIASPELYTKDSDGDGVVDRGDKFPNDANESIDSDGDGIGDNADKCDSTPKGAVIGDDGCPPDTKATFSGDLMGTIYRDEALIKGAITVTDPNDGEAGMHPDNKDGLYGIFIVDESGQWTYTLTKSGLSDGDILKDKFLLASKGGDALNLTIIVNGKKKSVDNNTTTE